MSTGLDSVAGRDPNHVTVLMGTDIADITTNRTPVSVGVDQATHRLLVSAIVTGGGSSGTQYTEGDTTAPATGTLALGRYKSSAPTLTDGQQYGLQLDSAGNLKVTGSLSVGGTTDNSAYTAGSSTGTPTMGFYHSTIDTVTDGRAAAIGMTPKRGMFVNLQNASGTEVGTSGAPLQVTLANTGSNSTAVKVDGSAVTQPVSTTTVDTFPATQNVTAQDIATSTVAGFNGQSYIIGNPTANSSATFTLSGIQTAAIQITGIWTGTLRIEASVDGGTTYSSKFSRLPGTVYAGSSAPTSNCLLLAAVSNYNRLRIRASAAWTGTATITVTESVNEHVVDVLNPIRLLDSTTSTLMTIKPASTAALATDTGIVAALHPSSPLPVGTNLVGKVGIDQTTPGTTNAVSANQGTAAALGAGWPVLNGEANDTSGTFTNATQTTSVTAGSLDGYGNVLISINGTFSTATAVFEGSDDGGTTWYGISEADRTDSNVIESGYTTLTNTSRAWQISNPGWDSIRVRSTAVASGTVNVRISPSSAPTSAGASVSIGTALPAGANTIGTVAIAASQTISVTNAGTFATQPTIQTGTNSIGKVSDITTSVVPGTGATNLGKAEDAAHTSGDTGVFTLGVRNDGAATAFSSTNGDYTPLATDAQGRLYVVQKSPTATLSNVSSSATNVTILAANTARMGAQFYNDSTAILYLKFGTTASATSFTVPLAAATYYELPGGYTGNIDGIWVSANGACRVTELT